MLLIRVELVVKILPDVWIKHSRISGVVVTSPCVLVSLQFIIVVCCCALISSS